MTDHPPDESDGSPGRSAERSARTESEPLADVVEEARNTVDADAIESSVSSISETVEAVFDGTDTADSVDLQRPAFEFEATTQQTIYVRPSGLRELEDLQALVDARLRRDHDVRNLTGSEFYDAVVRVAAAHDDEVLAAILEARAEGDRQ